LAHPNDELKRLRALVDNGHPTAERDLDAFMVDCPDLYRADQFYWNAFWQINTDRPSNSAGISAISYMAIDAYARREGLEGSDFYDLFNIVRAMDAEFIDHVAKASKAPKKPAR
jgi:hypothetical protein